MQSGSKIAVVGSGIAGLAASWYLGTKCRVSLYEKQMQLGMAAHGLELGGARVDMPLRVLYRGYYPTLSDLYAQANIDTIAADYSASFSDLGGDAYFRYSNWQPTKRLSIPFLQGGQPWGRRSRRIVADLLKLYRRAARDSQALQGSDETLQSYLDRNAYSAEFSEGFLLPTFAAINTCTIDSVRTYPALVIVDYLRRGVLLEGVSRTVKGADFVVKQLSQHCVEQRLASGIASLAVQDDGVIVTDEHGHSDQFSDVVIATQGNQALRLLGADASTQEQQALSRFRYEPSEVVVHTDERLMPAKRKHWSPVNFLVDEQSDRPMASIWLNKVLPVAKGTQDAIQTWNPLLEPRGDRILGQARFERPVVDEQSQKGLQQLSELHQQPGRRIWFCGSYAESGVPLLESAARSAQSVAQRILARNGE
ncbi:MAG: NAD(P)-binding protein [Oceanococcus sp.]